MIFMIKLKDQTEKAKKKEEIFQLAKDKRDLLLKDLKKYLDKDFDVEVNYATGVLNIKDAKKELFKPGEYKLTEDGIKKFDIIKRRFMEKIPCYGDFKTWKNYCYPKNENLKKLNPHFGLLDTILIEGHTDKTKIGNRYTKKYKYEGNYDLSSRRAVYTYQLFTGDLEKSKKTKKKRKKNKSRRKHQNSNKEILDLIKNSQNKKIFGVSGYGPSRSLGGPRYHDRRIAFRFIMSDVGEIKKVEDKKDQLLNNFWKGKNKRKRSPKRRRKKVQR